MVEAYLDTQLEPAIHFTFPNHHDLDHFLRPGYQELVANKTEEVPPSRLYISALTIGLSYFLGGLIPLIPYMALESAEQGLMVSCIVTGVVLFFFGLFKTYFT